MARRYRPRKLFKFWLYRDLAEDIRVMEYIDFLLKTNQFTKTIRNGLRLMWSLGEGDLSILFELFPGLRVQFKPDNTALIEEFKRLLQAQQSMMFAQPAPSVALPMGGTGNLKLGGGKGLDIARPNFDDDDDQDTVVIRTTAPEEAEDFLTRMMRSCEALANAPVKEQRVSAPREFHNRGVAGDNPEKRPVSVDDSEEPLATGKRGKKLTSLQPLR